MAEPKPSFSVVMMATANKSLNSLCHFTVAHFKDGKFDSQFDSLVGIPGNEKITNKQYQTANLTTKTPFRDASHQFEAELTHGDIIVTFDNNLRILKETLGTLNPYDFFFFDALDLFKATLKGKVKKITLENIAQHFDVEVPNEDEPVAMSKAIGEIIAKMYSDEHMFDREVRSKVGLKRFVEYTR